MEAEVLVVGGGPAGLATAIAARQAGFEVDVLERSVPPIDKACGEGLMPSGRDALGILGIDVEALGGFPFQGIRYIDGVELAEGLFSSRPGLGVRRLELHRELQRRAEEVGVRCHWGHSVRSLDLGVGPPVLHTDAGNWSADWLVAADGLHSRLRKWAGLEGRPCSLERFGVRRHYSIEPWSEFVEVYWTDRCEAYVTPVSQEEVGVAMLWSGGKANFDDLLGEFPHLQSRLGNARASSKDRGAGPFRQRVRAVTRGNIALVGDASGYLDALTGEGLAIAFRQALALVEAIRARDLGSYRRAHRRIVRSPETLTKLTLLLSRHPRLRRKVIRILADDPSLFSSFLALQNDEASLVGDGVKIFGKLLARIALSG